MSRQSYPPGKSSHVSSASATNARIFKNVIAAVDVRTSEGDDSSQYFADILKTCGAKVLVRPGETCTHLIFKAGRSSTLSWYHKHPEPKPFLLEASWVTKSKDAGRMLSEADFAIDANEQAVFNRRRKSMEPKQLAAIMNNDTNPALSSDQPSFLANLAQARRKSMQFAPRISSPLRAAQRLSNTHTADVAMS